MPADTIARGYGIGVLPSWLAECPRHGLRGQFARVIGDWEAAPVELAGHVHRGPRVRSIQVLAEYLRTHIPRRWTLVCAEPSFR